MRPHSNNTRTPRAIARTDSSFGLWSRAAHGKRRAAHGKHRRPHPIGSLLIHSLLAATCLCALSLPARAGRQPGAPRLLRFVWSDPRAAGDPAARRVLDAPASLSQAVFSAATGSDSSRLESRDEDGDAQRDTKRRDVREREARERDVQTHGALEVFFTRTAVKTSNLWRARVEDEGAPSHQGERFGESSGEPSSAKDDGATAKDGSDVDETARVLGARGKVLRARPLTRFKAPFFASGAVPTPDGRAVLCVTNALGLDGAQGFAPVDPSRRRIARLDLESGRMTALSSDDANSYAPAIAPDGTRFAFVSDRFGFDQVFVAAMDGGDARRVEIASVSATGNPGTARALSRRPFWLDNDTLIFEGTRRGQVALYRLSMPRRPIDNASDHGDAPQIDDSRIDARPGSETGQAAVPSLLFKRGGQGATAPNGNQLCVATQSADDETGRATFDLGNKGAADGGAADGARLYFLAGDGSTVRTVPGTEGARHPAFSPDGSALLYDAPLDSSAASSAASSENGGTMVSSAGSFQGSAPDMSTRGLWLLPMMRVAPTARLLGVRALTRTDASRPELEIVGTAFTSGDDAPRVQLEWGEGDEPSQWNTLPLHRVPAQAAALGTWRPAARARGPWMLRLTVTDSDGDSAQSFLPVARPFPAAASGAIAPGALPDGVTAITIAPFGGSSFRVAPSDPPSPGVASSRVASSSGAPSRTGAPPSPRTSPQGRARTRTGATDARVRPPQIASSSAAARTVAALPPLPLPAPNNSDVEPDSTQPGARQSNRLVRNREAGNESDGTSDGASQDDFSLPPFPIPLPGPLPEPDENKRDPNDDFAASQPSRPNARRTAPAKNTTNAESLAPSAATRNAATRNAASRAEDDRKDDGRNGEAPKVDERASIAVTGAPQEATVGTEVEVAVRIVNRGREVWRSQDERPTRLLVRWRDLSTGRRVRWEIKWLSSDVRPGGGLVLPVSISAPPRAGRYALSFSLVRLNGTSYQPPPTDPRAPRTSTSTPEFATTSFTVTVR